MKVRNILLATDLSMRCDRALARAAKIASEHSAHLCVAHAIPSLVSAEDQISWRRPANPLQVARRKVLADLSDYDHLKVDVLIEHAEPAEMILNASRQLGSDLIVTGMARDEIVGRISLGKTVNTIVRESDVPVLVVKSRVRRAYEKVIVATDFSEGSRCALETALSLLPEAHITLFHAYDVEYETFLEDKAAARASMHRKAMETSRAFIAEVVPQPDLAARILPVCEYGYAGTLLSDRAQADETDLIVLGTEGRSGLAGFLLGSAAQRLATELPVDVLLVRRRRN